MTISGIIKDYNLNKQDEKQYLDYIANHFMTSEKPTEYDYSFLDKWKAIVQYAKDTNAGQALNQYVCAKRPVEFIHPELINIEIYESFAGKIPIIYFPYVDDFEAFVINAVHKGKRPENLSKTGASFIFGKSTRFIALSTKPYSNVPASELGLRDDIWAQNSMIIRREHECTHYYTMQNYGVAKNCLHDELIADFFGLYEAFGEYKSEYFLQFMGVIGDSGDRLKVYTNELSDNVKRVVRETAIIASKRLEEWSKTSQFQDMDREERVKYLCEAGIEKIVEM